MATKTDKTKKTVVSYRRSCKTQGKGTGLSHYILVDDKKKGKK